MHSVPGSQAMDAAAGGAGPSGQVLPWIISAEPQSIIGYVAHLTRRIAELADLFQRLDQLRGDLRRAWPSGAASDAADRKLTATTACFQRLRQEVTDGADRLHAAATMINMIQVAYRATIGATNPTVAALWSSPHTRPAATSLAVSTTASLHGQLMRVHAALRTIADAEITATVSALATITREVDGLLSAGPAPRR